MTKARILTLADEVAKDLAQGTWEIEFVSGGRKYVPVVTIEEADQPLVTVVPVGQRMSTIDRTTYQYEYDLDIGVQHRLSGNQDEETYFDPAMRLLEQIADKYRSTRPTIADCVLTEVAFGGPSGLPYLPDHIHQFKQFTGVVRLTFREWR